MNLSTEYCKNKLCVPAKDLVRSGVLTESNYKVMARRGQIDVVRPGNAARKKALVAVNSLPPKQREKLEAATGSPAAALRQWITSNYRPNHAAVAFFMEWAAHSASPNASKETAGRLAANAALLDCCLRLAADTDLCRRLVGRKGCWLQLAAALDGLRAFYGHTLPASERRLRAKALEYQKTGFSCLVSRYFGNKNNNKTPERVQRLLISLKVLPNQPYDSDVFTMYCMFLRGTLEVCDFSTGELLNPADFVDGNGKPLALSKTTIRNILNQPAAQFVIEKALRGRMEFYHEQMPHIHRHGGRYALSQVTMDDVDLPRRMSGGAYVHAYYAYDVVSQCRIGMAYGRKKDDSLVTECFRDMFRLLARNNWGVPAGIEIEQHLMSKYKDGLLKAGRVFNFVRFCAPQNSQEKYAEALNGAFKTTIAHKNHENIGRWYGKGARRVDQKKISDSDNHTYEDRKYYTFDELVADDRRDSYEWNHAPHPDQKKYPGLSRWDVLTSNINPNLRPLDRQTLSLYIGEHVPTAVRRNSTVTVCGREFWLSSPQVLESLDPNNRKVTACYLPDDNGQPQDIYLYQNGRYIDTPRPVATFSRIMSEQTPHDREMFTQQCKVISRYTKYLKDNASDNIGIVETTTAPAGGSSCSAPTAPTPAPQEDAAANLPDLSYYDNFPQATAAIADI